MSDIIESLKPKCSKEMPKEIACNCTKEFTQITDIERILEKIREEKDNLIAKAFTCQILSLLLTNGIVPIMTEHSFEHLNTITDSDRYKLVYDLGVTFESLDTSEHDKKVRANAIEEMYNEILYIESKFRSMLVNTSQEDNLIEWVDLNGKLTAITTIKHLIGDKVKEQKNE